ncbi:iron-containing redox enzyme family protein [Leucobacter rhizosphaerae]|uniref:iron-containing redox enzyme family protein n=1 Tax=Leucobacter rhizosphaerae TaxID=2932245 RepID=UPI003D28C36B
MPHAPTAVARTDHARPDGLPFPARGPLSRAVLQRLVGGEDLEYASWDELVDQAVSGSRSIAEDEDIQLALFALYASAYGSIPEFSAELEWEPQLLRVRRSLEAAFEAELRTAVPMPELPEPNADAVARALFALTGADSGPSVSRYLAKKATAEQAREFLIQRSIYTLREADPHSWAIPRLHGRPKAALVEIQSDEYGGGRPERVHATLFAAAMRGAGLDDRYGAYLDAAPAATLASLNTMSMFGLNRRLLGAIVGHLAAFEMTSSIPSRLVGDGLKRLGFGPEVTDYFDEHVEADAVHEQIAARDLAGALAEDHPELLPDIIFGAAACLAVDGWMGRHQFDAWTAGGSSLRAGATGAGASAGAEPVGADA